MESLATCHSSKWIVNQAVTLLLMKLLIRKLLHDQIFDHWIEMNFANLLAKVFFAELVTLQVLMLFENPVDRR